MAKPALVLNSCAYAFGHLRRLQAFGIRENKGKLFAAVTASNICFSALAKDLAKSLNDTVSKGVAMFIVE